MPCHRLPLLPACIALAAVCLLSPASAHAQQPPAAVPLAPYRAPLIALVQPPLSGSAGSVPRDRPVVVFRFAAGEADDPLDVRSLVIAVNGIDRTALFATTATQAWGPLADDGAIARGQFAAGAHRVAARICSTRGACTTTEAQVLVLPALVSTTALAGAPPDGSTAKRAFLRRALGALGEATRKLILP